jgi:hypothetical protein
MLFSALLSPVFHMLEAVRTPGEGHQPLREAAALLLAQEQLINQGFGSGSVSGSAWIRINLSCWIRIRIQIADPGPDPGGQK